MHNPGYYRKFLCNFADIADPLYKIVNKEKFLWNDVHQRCYDDLKNLISTPPSLNYYNPDLPIGIATDASKKGLGAVLFHIEVNGKEMPIAYASRTLLKAEINYTNIEREALAIVYAVKKFQEFLIGSKFVIITDHKPLVYIFTKGLKDNTSISMRLQKWNLAMGAYDFTIVHRAGNRNTIPDCLSRLPQRNTEEGIQNIENNEITSDLWDIPINFQRIVKETNDDDELMEVINNIKHGEDIKNKTYKNMEMELSLIKCLFKEKRIIIPRKMRNEMLKDLKDI
ncbi:unnamed protein product [Gordionus sp. m RMFG-2023]